MKLLLLALVVLLPIQASAERRGSPFPPAVDKRFDELENDVLEQAGAARKYAKFTYDVAIDGGSSTADKALGVTLPAGAVITNFYVYINTLFADSGTGSVALECSGTRDLMGWQDLTALPIDSIFARGLGEVVFGTSSYIGESAQSSATTAAKTFNNGVGSIPTACEVTAVVRGDSGFVAQTAGKLTGIVEYFIR